MGWLGWESHSRFTGLTPASAEAMGLLQHHAWPARQMWLCYGPAAHSVKGPQPPASLPICQNLESWIGEASHTKQKPSTNVLHQVVTVEDHGLKMNVFKGKTMTLKWSYNVPFATALKPWFCSELTARTALNYKDHMFDEIKEVKCIAHLA